MGAAYGVIVALFQWGWGESFLDFTSVHSITSWLPLFMFVVLFGLSMDYHVFILSRIRWSYEEMGVGLAVAVLLDATIVRALLLPAVMKLLGPRNWYLPGWLEWLPRTSEPIPPPAGRAPRRPVTTR